jgi:hypothetical protein
MVPLRTVGGSPQSRVTRVIFFWLSSGSAPFCAPSPMPRMGWWTSSNAMSGESSSSPTAPGVRDPPMR